MKFEIRFGIIALPLISFFIFTVAYGSPTLDSAFGHIIKKCDVKSDSHVWIFKQWHLSPQVNTKKDSSDLPQKDNQTAIYRQIDKWVSGSKVSTVFSEGCAGEITETFSTPYNGWDLPSLSKEADKPHFDEIISLIPLKLKAKFHGKIHVYCADDDNLIKKQNEILSDARGNLGFLARIEQYKDDPERVKIYLKKIIELDHLPKNASPDQAIVRLKGDLKENVKNLESGLEDRNKKFFESIKKTSGDSVFVVGGLHVPGLVDLLKKNNIDCTIIEPVGYKAGDEKVIEELKDFKL